MADPQDSDRTPTIDDLIESENNRQREARRLNPDLPPVGEDPKLAYRKKYGAYKAFLEDFDADPDINQLPELNIDRAVYTDPEQRLAYNFVNDNFYDADAVQAFMPLSSDMQYISERTGLNQQTLSPLKDFNFNKAESLRDMGIITDSFFRELVQNMPVSTTREGDIITGGEVLAERDAERGIILTTMDDVVRFYKEVAGSTKRIDELRGRMVQSDKYFDALEELGVEIPNPKEEE
tara:strand:- start:45 stop:752 length:708 start_codon:yes stop_codon:yes gene_type:complete